MKTKKKRAVTPKPRPKKIRVQVKVKPRRSAPAPRAPSPPALKAETEAVFQAFDRLADMLAVNAQTVEVDAALGDLRAAVCTLKETRE